jgi:ribonuclease D
VVTSSEVETGRSSGPRRNLPISTNSLRLRKNWLLGAALKEAVPCVHLRFYMSTAPLSDQQSIGELAAQLAAAPWIALDTEFLRERTYRPQLCLLQLAVPGAALCVDPLADIDLEALRPALAGGTTPKILHAARQDLEVLWPVFGPLAPLFDTQIAAALTGLPAQIGYSDLVRRLLGVELPKGQTRTDWSKRPLSDAQLHYAIDDVIHLAPLREQLLEQLERLGRLAWLAEDLAGLALAERLFIDPERAHERLRWSADLDSDRARLLQRLAAWRERRAVDKNRPRSWILEDAALRTLVIRPPRTAADLAAITELAPGFIERSGAQILREIEAAELPTRLPPLPPRPRPDPAQQARVRHLSAIVQKRAGELGLAAEILATRKDLESIVRGEPDAEVLQGWRRSVVGQELLGAG